MTNEITVIQRERGGDGGKINGHKTRAKMILKNFLKSTRRQIALLLLVEKLLNFQMGKELRETLILKQFPTYGEKVFLSRNENSRTRLELFIIFINKYLYHQLFA